MKKTNKKVLISSLLIIAILGTAGIMFAYWISNVSAPGSGNSNIGIDVGEAPIAHTKLIVPEKATADSSNPEKLTPETNALIFTASVAWALDGNFDIGGESYSGTLSYSVTNTDTNGVILVDVQFSNSTLTLEGEAITATITVSMDFSKVTPGNIESYSNESFDINIAFNLALN